MKVGYYVRTKHYGIFKVLDIFKENRKTKVLVGKGHTVTIYDDEILKEDIEPINLIEEGDFVNGLRIDSITEKSDICEERVLYHDHDDDFYGIYANEIKTIVTKEQFESMEYKIGE